MNASYVSATQFTIAGDQTALFPAGRRVRGDCGVDGYKYGTVQSSSYSDPNTTVTLEESVLTSNLATVHYGVVKPGATGSLPDHASEHHSGGRDPIDHGSLPGLGDDDHTQYIKHALATAVSDFLVASGAGVFIKKTLAEVQALIEGSTNLADAISKKHAKDEDTYLDKGGANEVTAAQAKAAYTHAGVTSGNPHQVSRSDLGLATTDSPVFVNAKLSGLANGKIPYHVDDATGFADGPTKTDVDDAVSNKHVAASVGGAPLTLSGQQVTFNYDTNRMELDGNNLRNKVAAYTDIDTGTDANKTVTPDALNHSIHGIKRVIIKVLDDATELTTGDGKFYFTVPPEWNGMNIVDFDVCISTVSSSGAVSVAFYNVTDSQDILSTNATIDESEYSSYTAATAPVIDTDHDDLATGDRLRIDIDGAGTGAKGLEIHIGMRKP